MIVCAHCGKKSNKPPSAVNRAKRDGLEIYCNRKCSGLGRRKHKTKAQKIEEKRLYDEQYRAKNLAMITEKKREYFQRTYDPVKAAIGRKRRAKQHAEYCRQPEYREWKKGYDKQYLAKKNYGDFGDAFLVLMDVEKEINSRITRYEVYQQNGTINKWIQRRRHYEQETGRK